MWAQVYKNPLGVLKKPGGASRVTTAGGLDLDSFIATFKNAMELGAKGDGSLDTVALQNIFSNEEYIYFPAGTYKADQLTLQTGQKIVCARGAVFEASAGTIPVFDTSGVLHEIEWEGGKFRNCSHAFRHSGNSALAYCRFSGIKFNDLGDGFELSSSVGNDFIGCWFGVNGSADNIHNGINFTGSGTGQTNVNNIERCKFLLFRDSGITIADSANVKISNIIERCWFEDSNGYGVYIGGLCRSTKIADSYFETCGNAAHPDIRIDAASGSILNTLVEGNSFQTANTTQTERIKLTGNTDIRARNNSVMLKSGQVMVDVSSAGGPFHTELKRNYLNVVGGTDYKSSLSRKSGTQQVSWSDYVGSGGVSGDEYPVEVYNGVTTSDWIVFTNGDATPSVQSGHKFKTAGTTAITNFDDGIDGQKITIRAGNTITVLGVTMSLGDIAEFINDGGTWRHVNK